MANPVFAWTGTDGRLNVQIGASGKPSILNQTSNRGPAIAYFNSLYYLAWTGTDGQLNYLTSSDGINWPQNTNIVPQQSRNGPILAVASGSLYLGWTGTDGRLNYLQWVNTGWSNQVISPQTSDLNYDLIFT